jgi:aminoglycoside phosphotransferase (APT) family kinase protein
LRAPDLDTFTALVQPEAPGGRVVAATPLAHGLANRNYRLDLAGAAEPLLARFYLRDPDSAEKERAVSALVRPAVPAPEFLHLGRAEAGSGRPYAIQRWIAGDLLQEVLPRADAAALRQLGQAVGATLAALAAHRFSVTGMLDARLQPIPWPETALDFIHRCLFAGQGAARLDEPTRRSVWRFVSANAGLIEGLAADSRLVHADYGARNLIMARHGEGWRVAGVIDWEFCHAGTPLFDIGILLRGAPRPAFEQGFADAFRAGGGELPPDWRRVARFIDLVNLCDFLQRPDAPERLVAYARDLLLDTVRQWDDG